MNAAFARLPGTDLLINNAGIADYDLINVITPERWHRLFAYVPQGNQLMSGTIREVVTFTSGGAFQEEKFRKALKQPNETLSAVDPAQNPVATVVPSIAPLELVTEAPTDAPTEAPVGSVG